MKEPKFQWDENKNRTNRSKHGISFEEASTAFRDEYGRIEHDPDHSDEEDRFVLLGMSQNTRLLVVCHCYRAKNSVIRIISARKATQSEKKLYMEHL